MKDIEKNIGTRDILEEVAGELLSRIIPAVGVTYCAIVAVQIFAGQVNIKLLPTLVSILLFLLAFLLIRRGRKLLAARILIFIFTIGLVVLLVIERTWNESIGMITSSVIICWVSWFTPRRFSMGFLVVFLITYVVLSILNASGIITGQESYLVSVRLISVPFAFIILYVSIRAPVQLLLNLVEKSKHGEEIVKRTLDELKESQNFTIQAVDQSRQFFGWLTPAGVVQYCNALSLALINKTIAEIVGKLFWETPWFDYDTGEAERLRNAIERVRTGDTISYSISFPVSSGKTRDIDLSLHPIYDTNGAITMIVAEGRDCTSEHEAIHQKEKITEQLHQMQKMEAVGQLAGGIAHDFNNSLASIIGGAELLLEDDLPEETRRSYINMILTAAERAGELTKKLLVFSRKGGKTMGQVDVVAIVTETIGMLSRTLDKKIVITLENHARHTIVNGDDVLLQNALLNMGINAGHVMPDGGNLVFTLATTTLDEEYCRYSSFELVPGEFIIVSVRDTGTGIPSEIQSRIFEPFFTTKPPGKGTGLGLAAVYGTIQDHHGAITVYSESGKGTVFHIYLPLTDAAVQYEYEKTLRRGVGTILLVDDEELIRITASAILTRLGYRVLLAENGMAGVTLYEEHRSEIGLVLLDMIMPVMGGREVFKKIRDDDPTIPIIIASGYSREEDEQVLREQGASGVLLKPFRRGDLAEMVAKLIRHT